MVLGALLIAENENRNLSRDVALIIDYSDIKDLYGANIFNDTTNKRQNHISTELMLTASAQHWPV